MAEQIATIIASLGALGGVISMLVNVLKSFGVIKDDQSEKWVGIINLIVYIIVAVIFFLNVPADWAQVNGYLEVAAVILGYLVQILGSKLAYPLLKGTPAIGYSYSLEKDRQKTEAVG